MPNSRTLNIPPNNYHLLAATQELYQKACLLVKNTEEFSGEKKEEMNGPVGRKKDRTEKKQREQTEHERR